MKYIDKFLWNTLDFEPTKIIRDNKGKIKKKIKTRPFAYNGTSTNMNINLD